VKHTTVATGVVLTPYGTYRAQANLKGKCIHLGCFPSKEQAVAARKSFLSANPGNDRRRRVWLPFTERFWLSVAKSEGCWEWTGFLLGNGYGQVGIKNTQAQAHRVSWEMHYGPIPQGLYVLHHCDNRKCVRPDHLFLGTIQDNADDMVAKERQAQGVRHGLAKLDDRKVQAIRELCRRFPPTLKRRSQSYGVLSFLARWFGVGFTSVSLAAKSETWRNT